MGEPALQLVDNEGTEETFGSAAEKLEREYKITDLGNSDSLRYVVLNLVAENQFDKALVQLKEGQRIKSNFPGFFERTGRHFDYCEELINAIRSKKNIPNFKKLPVNKQQDINKRIVHHFSELSEGLRRLEMVEREIKLVDSKATVWVVKAGSGALFLVLAAGAIKHSFTAVGISLPIVLEALLNDFFKTLGF